MCVYVVFATSPAPFRGRGSGGDDASGGGLVIECALVDGGVGVLVGSWSAAKA